jgi:hypothetical protein
VAANKLSYLLGAVQTALSSEPTFTVQLALNKSRQPTPGRVLVYPFIVSATQSTLYESGGTQEGAVVVRIWSDVPVASEGATVTGKSFAAYADTIAKIEKAIRTIAFGQQETHTDGTKTAIHTANVTLVGGHVDNGDNKIEADCDVTLTYGFWQ